jgi:multicomponent Na+:H+ antiporter subunit A
LFFDLGVYLIVVGLVLDVLRSLGARLDVEMAERRPWAAEAR